MINKYIIYKFFKEFINNRNESNKAAAFSHRLLPNIFWYSYTDETIQQFGKQNSFLSSSESPLEYNQD